MRLLFELLGHTKGGCQHSGWRKDRLAFGLVGFVVGHLGGIVPAEDMELMRLLWLLCWRGCTALANLWKVQQECCCSHGSES